MSTVDATSQTSRTPHFSRLQQRKYLYSYKYNPCTYVLYRLTLKSTLDLITPQARPLVLDSWRRSQQCVASSGPYHVVGRTPRSFESAEVRLRTGRSVQSHIARRLRKITRPETLSTDADRIRRGISVL